MAVQATDEGIDGALEGKGRKTWVWIGRVKDPNGGCDTVSARESVF